MSKWISLFVFEKRERNISNSREGREKNYFVLLKNVIENNLYSRET